VAFLPYTSASSRSLQSVRGIPLRRQKACQTRLGDQGARTFAISPQLLPASRIVFSLCSSVAVQGVFVLPFFLPASPGVALTGADVEGVGTVGAALVPSAGAESLEGDPVGLDPALLEA
jgi:hypothetical protein